LLKTKNLSFTIGDKYLLKHIDLNLKRGIITGLIGPNGSGKSTLLKNIYRVLTPTQGEVLIDDKKIHSFKNREIARKMSVVSQDDVATNFDFKVLDIVLMGRFAHKKIFDMNTQNDIKRAIDALEKVNMVDFITRSYMSLSGGEKQRIMIARAICQDADILIMDEPTNHLDIKYQLSIMNYIKAMKVTTFIAIHDINIAMKFCDELVVLKNGCLEYLGKTEEIITPKMMKHIFDVNVQLILNKKNNKFNIIYDE